MISRDLKFINDDKMHFIFTAFSLSNSFPNYSPSHYYGYFKFSAPTHLFVIKLLEFNRNQEINDLNVGVIVGPSHFYIGGYMTDFNLNSQVAVVSPLEL
jgi:hypothetical protein